MKSIILTSLAIALTVGVCGCSSDKKEKAEGEGAVPVIDVAMPVVDSVTVYKSYPGYMTATDRVDLVARVNGYLISHPYENGSFVKKGQVLFNIESTQYADAVRQAQASLADARATYDYASKNYAAMQKAYAADAVSQMELLQSKSSMEEAEAAIQQAKAQLTSAQTTLSYCTVRAPLSGHITSSAYSDGSYLAGAGSPVVLATIYDDSVVKVNFNIDDSQLIDLLKRGVYKKDGIDLKHMPVIFSDSLPHKYTADLSYMAPSLDVSTGQMVVQAAIDNKYGELKPGMVATIKLPSEVLPKAILIQDAAISKDQLGNYVYVVNDSNKVVYTPVKVGDLVTPTLRLVTDGLKPDDRYVTKALLKVRDNMTVKPRLETAK